MIDAVSDATAEEPRGVIVRRVEPADAASWIALRTELWPEAPDDHPAEVAAFLDGSRAEAECWVAVRAGGALVGFAEVALRRWAEGCTTSPVGYLEGIYIDPAVRRTGVGRLLVGACADWARAMGCEEMASDRALEDERSGAFHEATGFVESARVVCYRAPIDGLGTDR